MQVDYAEQILAAAEAEEEECKILIDRLDEMLANGDIDTFKQNLHIVEQKQEHIESLLERCELLWQKSM